MTEHICLGPEHSCAPLCWVIKEWQGWVESPHASEQWLEHPLKYPLSLAIHKGAEWKRDKQPELREGQSPLGTPLTPQCVLSQTLSPHPSST